MRRTKGLLAALFVAGAVAVTLTVTGTSAAPRAAGPIKIGISLSLTGDFSDPGTNVKKGYELWAAFVNAHGGILGRKVQLLIKNDASSPDQVVTNYRNLITRDKVDLVFGPFSSLLTGPAATVANRYHYAMLGPAGGGPKVFALKLPNYFFVQPAPVVRCGDPFVAYIKSLPKAKQPKTASYPSLDDPFASPIADAMRAKFEAMGVKTLYHAIYPAETTDVTPVVEKAIAGKPDMIAAGTQSIDAYNQVKALIQAKYNPKFLFFANGANAPVDFPGKVGRKNVNGIFSCSDWTPTVHTSGNPLFVSTYLKKYGGSAFDIDNNSAEAWAVGQLLQLAAKKTGTIDNQTLIKALHGATWPTIEGNLAWDSSGSPNGSDLLVEWVGGKLVAVYPKQFAVAKPFSPKPPWGS